MENNTHSNPRERLFTDEPFNVLLSSAGRRVSLLRSFRRSLADLGIAGLVFASDASPLSAAFHASDGGFLVPPCSDPTFVPVLLDVCARKRVHLVVPTIDTELPLLAAHRADFKAVGTVVAISSPDVIKKCSDKILTHEFLTRSGFPTVRQATLSKVREEPDRWQGPLVLKPRSGSAGIGVQILNDVSDLPSAGDPEGVIVQTVAPGDEYTVDVLMDRRSQVVCVVPRRRIEVRAGEVSKGVTERIPGIVELIREVCSALEGGYGALTVQLFLDRESGSLNVIEINPRFGGGFPLTWQAGGDYPRWMIEDVLGTRLGPRDNAWREGVVMLRFDDAVYVAREQVGVGP